MLLNIGKWPPAFNVFSIFLAPFDNICVLGCGHLSQRFIRKRMQMIFISSIKIIWRTGNDESNNRIGEIIRQPWTSVLKFISSKFQSSNLVFVEKFLIHCFLNSLYFTEKHIITDWNKYGRHWTYTVKYQ